MRVEVSSPEGLEAATRDPLENVEHGDGVWLLVTVNGYGIVFLDDAEMARVVAVAATVTA